MENAQHSAVQMTYSQQEGCGRRCCYRDCRDVFEWHRLDFEISGLYYSVVDIDGAAWFSILGPSGPFNECPGMVY